MVPGDAVSGRRVQSGPPPWVTASTVSFRKDAHAQEIDDQELQVHPRANAFAGSVECVHWLKRRGEIEPDRSVPFPARNCESESGGVQRDQGSQHAALFRQKTLSGNGI